MSPQSPPPTESEQPRPSIPGSREPPGDPAPAPTVAVAHYPEGAGHATRMLAVADELEARGAEVLMAGGGAGARFVALNGYDAFEPTCVDYIDTVQGGSVRDVLTGSLPATADRIVDYVGWLRETAPDALVTDDMFAAMAALRVDVPLYVLKHDMPGLYRSRLERAGAAFHTEFQVSAARSFFYPAVWPASGLAPEAATRVPPVALDGDAPDGDGADVVVVPSHYSDLGRIATALEREGYDVLDVGSDDWEPVPSLLPHLREAEVVVCSGYSTVMDAAVAGTPCVVLPATDEQEAVADRLRDDEVTGFAVADDPLDVLAAVADPPAPPAHANGAPRVAEAVLADLRRDDGPPAAAGAGSGPGEASLASGVGARAARTRAHVDAGWRRLATAGRATLCAGARAGRWALDRGRETAVATWRRARAVSGAGYRYGLASALVAASVCVFTGYRLRQTGDAATRALATLVAAFGVVTRRLWDLLTAAGLGLASAATGLRARTRWTANPPREAGVSGERE